MFGGVVLEIVVCVYIEILDKVIVEVLCEVGCFWEDVDVVVVMVGFGLIGGVIVGFMIVKVIVMVVGKLLIGINYFEGYVLMVCLIDDLKLLFFLLFVLGGYS